MKKIIIFLLLAAVAFAASCKEAEMNGGEFYIEGYYLRASTGAHVIIADNQGPCSMTAADGVSFDGLTDGDRIKVKTPLILTSYPGQLTAYSLEKLSDGERSDIDKETLKTLAELGWIE